uniref:Uncharacterized protein n=1 Tax=Ascaris lumbricoides TaxID=6252 RepID=A0A0M3I0H0_ASCLU
MANAFQGRYFKPRRSVVSSTRIATIFGMADGSALCSQLIQNVDDVDAASSEVRNTSFPGPSSYELRGNRRRSASAACVRLEEDRLRCVSIYDLLLESDILGRF